jgi:hypothetical protein
MSVVVGPRRRITPPTFTNEYSMTFDGVDEYVTMGDVLDTSDTGATALSISCWYKTTNSGTQMFVAKQNNSGNFSGFALSMQPNNKLSFFMGTLSGNQYLFVQSANVSTHSNGNWHHLAVTYDGSRSTTGINMYFNGSPLSVTSVNNVSPINVQNSVEFLLGARGLTYSNRLNGSLDEVAVFNTELSASDITTIYNSGVPNDLSSLSPVSWWRMGDGDTWGGSSWTLTDNGSGGNDATSVNMEEADRVTDIP